jgi:hypothetical protein
LPLHSRNVHERAREKKKKRKKCKRHFISSIKTFFSLLFFASFSATHVPPPMQRATLLSSALHKAHSRSEHFLIILKKWLCLLRNLRIIKFLFLFSLKFLLKTFLCPFVLSPSANTTKHFMAIKSVSF